MSKTCMLFCFTIVLFCSKTNAHFGIYELKRGDISVNLTNKGATILSLFVPDKNGKLADVVLGFDSIEHYMRYFGAIVGRVANRIDGAQFTFNGTHYKLACNEGRNMVHGGPQGFSDVVWKVKNYNNKGHSPCITFTYHSCDGDQGFPGDLDVSVTYTLGEQGLSVTMEAEALNKPTPVNLVQHTYWNLGGHDSGDILSNEVQIFGSNITPIKSDKIPTGEITSVKGTPYDFLKPTIIAANFADIPSGYDINYVLDGGDGLKTAAIVHEMRSGRVMEVLTNQPGMQFFTADFIKDFVGKGGFVYQANAGLCLETQGFPDAVNHPNFPSQIIFPGNKYVHRMLYKFSIKC